MKTQALEVKMKTLEADAAAKAQALEAKMQALDEALRALRPTSSSA